MGTLSSKSVTSLSPELQSAQTDADTLKHEVEGLNQRTRALEEAVGRQVVQYNNT